ncbi:hypothetical protein HMPREF1008_01439 [Olsenella sp. oral taxon 809 str. F0356]|uniref:ABC transporter ATP-binding protein n=1 Tax=Olsenella sp. oral taxon 809 TaxID=661086 RepID=UPI000231EE80|nr:ABC transporter ATP-binding protein [Olsenella sp. oral taxon 809]EHF01815.1 hypothetical protein HMPREF1008_01439 [Olsenella sp. oral taxon 809 str. F0356]
MSGHMGRKLALGTLDLGGEPSDLRVRGLRKSYEGFELRGIDLDLPRGSVMGLVGQNGAGKTTIMRAITGSLVPDAGEVELFGHPVSQMGSGVLREAKGAIGFVSSTCPYPGELSVAQVATMHALAYERFDWRLFQELSERMGLLPHDECPHRSHAARKRVRELSRGMGMKLQLACALATGARVLVLDEPTAGLDPIVREEVLGILREWMEAGDRSALISSHITSDLEHVADYLLMVDDGRVVFQCERDLVNDVMGIARLREAELERVRADGLLKGAGARVLRRDLSYDLLVPDRAEFLRAYPLLACDAADIDELMLLVVRGEEF